MFHIWKNELHLEKWVSLGKMGHIWKNVTMEKWVKLGRKGHTCKKWVALQKNGSQFEEKVTVKKWVTFKKMGQT